MENDLLLFATIAHIAWPSHRRQLSLCADAAQIHSRVRAEAKLDFTAQLSALHRPAGTLLVSVS